MADEITDPKTPTPKQSRGFVRHPANGWIIAVVVGLLYQLGLIGPSADAKNKATSDKLTGIEVRLVSIEMRLDMLTANRKEEKTDLLKPIEVQISTLSKQVEQLGSKLDRHMYETLAAKQSYGNKEQR